jgi:hypothetical protein
LASRGENPTPHSKAEDNAPDSTIKKRLQTRSRQVIPNGISEYLSNTAYLKQFGSDGKKEIANAETRNISSTGRLDTCSKGDLWRQLRGIRGI